MLNLPLTVNVLFVHHFHGVTPPPKMHCQKIRNSHQKSKSEVVNKIKYFTQQDAENEIKRLNVPHLNIKPYKCPVCEYWHIGKTSKLSFWETKNK